MIIEQKIMWSANQLSNACEKGIISLDNPRQRGFIWKPAQKSLLIHSIVAGFPIPGLYVVKDDTGQFSIIDGKQRSDAIGSYIRNEYALSKDTPLTELDNGESYQLSGKRFNELDESVKNKIRNRMLEIHNIDNINDDEVDEMFYRLNNGAAMSSVVITFAKTKCIEQINLASSHDIFQAALSKTALEKYSHKDLVAKAYMVLFTDAPTFNANDMRKAITDADITDEAILTIWDCLDRMYEVYEYIDKHGGEHKKVCMSNISKPTHFLALMPVIKNSIDAGISSEDFAKWVMTFYPGNRTGRYASIDDDYNLAAQNGKKENIQKRHDIIMKHYTMTFKAV
jgi:hypothetical protein